MTQTAKVDNSTEPLQQYFREVGGYNLLGAEEERALAVRIAKGDKDAVNKMVEANLRLVIRIAKSYQSKGLLLADLIQEGNMGLMTAVEKFSLSHNVRFSTYAAWWIRQAISRALSNKAKSIRLPYRKDLAMRKLKDAMGSLQPGSNTDLPSAAASAGISYGDALDVLPFIDGVSSLDASIGEDTVSLYDSCASQLASPESLVMMDELRNGLNSLVKMLDAREQEILNYRYNLEGIDRLTLKSISEKVGMSAETVRQVELRALRKMATLGSDMKAYLA